MDRDKLRAYLDGLGEEELIKLRDELDQAPEGHKEEIEGISVPKNEALLLVNQAIVMES